MMPGVVVVWCGGGFFTDNNTTATKVVLSCFGLLVGLWQLLHLSQSHALLHGIRAVGK